MAENEEIIEITFYNKRRGGERLPQMTLSEAVERMAKAMAANDVGGYIILAEAALAALFGEHK